MVRYGQLGSTKDMTFKPVEVMSSWDSKHPKKWYFSGAVLMDDERMLPRFVEIEGVMYGKVKYGKLGSPRRYVKEGSNQD